jgi:hypothetical protein
VFLTVIASVAGLPGTTGIAAAAINVELTSPVITPSGNATFPFTWSYTADLNTSEEIAGTAPCKTKGTTGAHGCEFLTLYDVQGFQPSSIAWTPTLGSVTGTVPPTSGVCPGAGCPFIGPDAIGQSVTDSSSIRNLFVEFSCATVACPVFGTGAPLGILSFNDRFSGGVTGVYAAQANDLSNHAVGNNGSTLIPSPEPASFALLASGLPVFGGVMALRRRRNGKVDAAAA